MKSITLYISLYALFIFTLTGCSKPIEQDTEHDGEQVETSSKSVELSELKFNSLGIEIGPLPKKVLSELVSANGKLQVPPQYEASVTTTIGANIANINVIEGDKVKKGRVLAYTTHPNLLKIQNEYIQAISELEFLKLEVERKSKLYKNNIAAGRDYQRVQSDFKSAEIKVKTLGAELGLLNIDKTEVEKGNIIEKVAIVSPIDGYIEKVNIQIGQYVDPQTALFEIVNTEHMHADIMIFEKDVSKVAIGQSLTFRIQSRKGSIFQGQIASISKQFEDGPKALHVHAEIDSPTPDLIPGMYINADIITTNLLTNALPEEAIIEDNGKTYIFYAEQAQEDNSIVWLFTPVEVVLGGSHNGWREVRLLEQIPENQQVAMNSAYYLISEMNKENTSHSH